MSHFSSAGFDDRCCRIALRAAKVGVWDWDIPNDRIEWSDRVYEIHGMQPGDFGGTIAHYRALVHPDDLDRVSAAIEDALASRKPYTIEFRIVRPGGDIRWVSASAESIVDEGGWPLRMTGATIDVTPAKAMEEALRHANDEVEQFAYRASHDLREPLRTVASFAQLLSREAGGRLGSQADEYISFILDGTRKMRALIDGLLALSQISGSRERPMESVSCARIVDDCIQALRDQVAGADAEIVRDDLPEVRGDAAQLKQVFQNLLSNAMKYRKPDAPPRIELSACRQLGGWRICVRDNGLGFDEAKAKDLFTPFRRLHGRDFPGSGLGLAICRKIVERHGGRIWAHAAPGEGASFYFTLPA